MGAVKQFTSLSTSYVNLAALLRYLRDQAFTGSVHLVVDHYEAEVQFHGSDAPTASEINPTTRELSQTPGAMERLLVHAREPGGTITVFSAAAESESVSNAEVQAAADEDSDTTPSQPPANDSAPDWPELLDSGGKVIGAVEQALNASGANFESSFHAARIELGDDYPFLDPTGNGLNYAHRTIVLNSHPNSSAFVTGLSECLRKVVNKMATGKESQRFRESVAIELAVAARLRPNGLGEFTLQLDRIAGTRVL
jgi:hypothetical protein